MPWTARAIWSAPPPVPAGMMNSTLFVGSHASAQPGSARTISAATAAKFRIGLFTSYLLATEDRAPTLKHRLRSIPLATLKLIRTRAARRTVKELAERTGLEPATRSEEHTSELQSL